MKIRGYSNKLTVSNDGHVPDVSPAVHQRPDLLNVSF
jgi:hypothetical protein